MQTRLETSNFNYHSDTRTFTQDASMLQDRFERMFYEFIPGESYKGFILCSERTGKEVQMHLEGRVKDTEGDVQFWRFVPGDPEAANFKELVVWND